MNRTGFFSMFATHSGTARAVTIAATRRGAAEPLTVGHRATRAGTSRVGWASITVIQRRGSHLSNRRCGWNSRVWVRVGVSV